MYLNTGETYIASTHDFLSSINCFATARAHIGAAKFLGKFGAIGVIGRTMCYLPVYEIFFLCFEYKKKKNTAGWILNTIKYTVIHIFHLLFRFDSQSFTRVHTQGPCSTTKTVAFWTIFFTITWLAVDLIHMYSYCGAIQILPAYHCEMEQRQLLSYIL